MPGMASVPRKGSRDFEPANCLHETGSECTKHRGQTATGRSAAGISPCCLVNCKVNGPVRTITDEPYEGNPHVRVRGGRREQSRPLPGSQQPPASPFRAVGRDSLLLGFV